MLLLCESKYLLFLRIKYMWELTIILVLFSLLLYISPYYWQTDTETDSHWDRHSLTDVNTETDSHWDRQSLRQTVTDRCRHWDRQPQTQSLRQTATETDSHWQTQTLRQQLRQTATKADSRWQTETDGHWDRQVSYLLIPPSRLRIPISPKKSPAPICFSTVPLSLYTTRRWTDYSYGDVATRRNAR